MKFYPKCFNCGNVGHIAQNYRFIKTNLRRRHKSPTGINKIWQTSQYSKQPHTNLQQHLRFRDVSDCNRKKGGLVCFRCGHSGHIMRNCRFNAMNVLSKKWKRNALHKTSLMKMKRGLSKTKDNDEKNYQSGTDELTPYSSDGESYYSNNIQVREEEENAQSKPMNRLRIISECEINCKEGDGKREEETLKPPAVPIPENVDNKLQNEAHIPGENKNLAVSTAKEDAISCVEHRNCCTTLTSSWALLILPAI